MQIEAVGWVQKIKRAAEILTGRMCLEQADGNSSCLCPVLSRCHA